MAYKTTEKNMPLWFRDLLYVVGLVVAALVWHFTVLADLKKNDTDLEKRVVVLETENRLYRETIGVKVQTILENTEKLVNKKSNDLP